MIRRRSAWAALVATIWLSVGIHVHAATDTHQSIFDPAFRTLQVTVNDVPQSIPVILLDSGDRITVSFDELAEDRSYLRYSLIHCNADWQPSALVDSEYLDGFNVAEIDDYAFSRATTAHYVNYSITLPNEQMCMKVSGNYLLRVYREDDPDSILLQARFMVMEKSASVDAEVTSRTDVDYNQRHQQLAVMVDTEQAGVRDPFNDLYVVITQNGRDDNKATLRQPLRISGNKSYYEHQPQLIFPGGNEYRRMETVSVHYPGMHVAEIGYATPYYHIELETDYPRNEDQYLYDQTQHGRFLVREYNSSESDTEADYIVTHFRLEMPELQGADIFLDGDFTQRCFDPGSRMVYDRADGAYRSVQMLKQGAYNYQYLVVPKGSITGGTAPVEGDFYQTINEYCILVYHRPPLARYDRLIGGATIMSGR